jgi:STE24 endopeptidase
MQTMQPEYIITAVILVAMLLDVILEITADVLNLKRLSPHLPEAFRGWYAPEKYASSQRYLRANTRFGWWVRCVDIAVILGFWFGGGFAILDQWVRSLHWSPVVSGLIYIGIVMAAKAVLGIPFGIYATFIIEERFGFNKTTWRTFMVDKLKALMLALVLGIPILAAILGFFQYAGPRAWVYAWLAVVIFMLAVQYIAPTWIMPLFNRFEPLPAGELRDAITAYARSIDFALENIFVMDGSKRSTKSNAFFTGFGRHRRIVLFDTLIARHSVDELVAVLAHEMGHYKKRHIFKMMAVGILQAGLMFYILSIFISYPGLFAAFRVQEVSVYAGLIFFSVLYAPLDGLLGLILQGISRKHEFEADRFAAATVSRAGAIVTALKKLSVDNLSNLQPHPLYVFLHYSHPPVLERIQAIEGMVEQA